MSRESTFNKALVDDTCWGRGTNERENKNNPTGRVVKNSRNGVGRCNVCDTTDFDEKKIRICVEVIHLRDEDL